MSEKPCTMNDVVDALNDLTRVTLAVSDKFETRSQAVRGLAELGIPSGRIAAILGMKSGDVASVIAKSKEKRVSEKRAREDDNG